MIVVPTRFNVLARNGGPVETGVTYPGIIIRSANATCTICRAIHRIPGSTNSQPSGFRAVEAGTANRVQSTNPADGCTFLVRSGISNSHPSGNALVRVRIGDCQSDAPNCVRERRERSGAETSQPSGLAAVADRGCAIGESIA